MALQGIRRIALGIVQDPAINSGRPIIERTRVFVDRIIGHLESGMSIGEICREYELTQEQVMVVKQQSQDNFIDFVMIIMIQCFSSSWTADV